VGSLGVVPDQLREVAMMSEELLSAANTDRELYREPDKGNGSFYSDSIHVTERGGIGINCGGHVFVKTLKDWHAMADDLAIVTAKAREMRHAIDMLEGALMGFGDLVDLPRKWGEPKHRDELGVSIPATAGAVYRVCEALEDCTRIINSDEYVFPK
jgi:hypothetical protein